VEAIADSDAFYDPERMLAQHQAALTLLQGMLSDPKIAQVNWLDLASGRGQIISHLEKNLSSTERSKIIFHGYDVENSYSRSAEKIALSMGLAGYNFEIGQLSEFWQKKPARGQYDFITLTNTVHEINPTNFAELLTRCIEHLGENGRLFIYDMEKLPTDELGAVLWTAGEIKLILIHLCRCLGSPEYEPSVGTWVHRSCNGWNAHIIRPHMQLPTNLNERCAEAIISTAAKVTELLRSKLEVTKGALESLTRFGGETAEEDFDKEGLLFQFWALSRALGGSA
jgi:hypothetical protein